MGQRGKYKIWNILLYFGDLLDPIVKIWRFQKKKNRHKLATLMHSFYENPLYE
jgi:hypothetical protein